MMNQQQEIPVYLFTGFLGGGKTTFIQDILSTTDFNEGERTLLLLCEEGEEDYDPSKFSYPNVYIETIDDEEDLTQERLAKLEKRHAIDRVVIEYNGMWMLQTLFQNMPPNWLIYQEVCFHDATTFLMYNQNMRQLCFDKMQTAELNIFNRCEKGFDKMPFHKEVRIANRRTTSKIRCRMIWKRPSWRSRMSGMRNGTAISTKTRRTTKARPCSCACASP